MTETPPIRGTGFSDAALISSLKTQLAEVTSDVSTGKVTVPGDVVADGSGFAVKLNVSKPNGQGFIYTISAADVDYYAKDPDHVIHELVDVAHDQLFKQQLRALLGPYVVSGIRNALTMKAKS